MSAADPQGANHSVRILLASMPEMLSGVCPVCKENWAADSEWYCSCTRPRPGDDEKMAAAYRRSANMRTARLAANRAAQEADMAARRARAAQRRAVLAPAHAVASSAPRPVVVAMAGRR